MPSTKVILDTDILADYLKGDNACVASRAEVYAQEHKLFTITSITLHDVMYGLQAAGARSPSIKALVWMQSNDILVPTELDYLSAARMRAAALSRGNDICLPDCLTAALASRLGFAIATASTAPFEAIRETGVSLTIDNWREPQP